MVAVTKWNKTDWYMKKKTIRYKKYSKYSLYKNFIEHKIKMEAFTAASHTENSNRC